MRQRVWWGAIAAVVVSVAAAACRSEATPSASGIGFSHPALHHDARRAQERAPVADPACELTLAVDLAAAARFKGAYRPLEEARADVTELAHRDGAGGIDVTLRDGTVCELAAGNDSTRAVVFHGDHVLDLAARMAEPRAGVRVEREGGATLALTGARAFGFRGSEVVVAHDVETLRRVLSLDPVTWQRRPDTAVALRVAGPRARGVFGAFGVASRADGDALEALTLLVPRDGEHLQIRFDARTAAAAQSLATRLRASQDSLRRRGSMPSFAQNVAVDVSESGTSVVLSPGVAPDAFFRSLGYSNQKIHD